MSSTVLAFGTLALGFALGLRVARSVYLRLYTAQDDAISALREYARLQEEQTARHLTRERAVGESYRLAREAIEAVSTWWALTGEFDREEDRFLRAELLRIREEMERIGG